MLESGVLWHLLLELSFMSGYRPVNKEELFNLHHTSARNIIKHIFGVLKQHFRILLLAPEYSLEIQAWIPAALCAIHNFICTHFMWWRCTTWSQPHQHLLQLLQNSIIHPQDGVILCMCCIVEHGEKSINSLQIQCLVFGKFWAKTFLTVFLWIPQFLYKTATGTRQNSRVKQDG